MTLQPFTKEQVNFFKFAHIVTNEFPKALRQSFKHLWDTTYGHRPGYRFWDDSKEVREMFLREEGGITDVPTNLSYTKWDCSTLFQATLYSQSFSEEDSEGRKTSLSEKYVKPHRLAKGELLTSIGKSSTSVTETFTIAINQLRILRNNLFHLTKAEIDTKTFGSYIQLSEKAFGFLNVATASIKAISSYSEDDFPTEKARKIREDIMRYMEAELRYIKNEILKESLHITKERNKELLESIIETFGNREKVLQELVELIKSGEMLLSNYGAKTSLENQVKQLRDDVNDKLEYVGTLLVSIASVLREEKKLDQQLIEGETKLTEDTSGERLFSNYGAKTSLENQVKQLHDDVNDKLEYVRAALMSIASVVRDEKKPIQQLIEGETKLTEDTSSERLEKSLSHSKIGEVKDPTSLEEVTSVPNDKQQTEEQSGEDESESFEETLGENQAISPSAIDKGKDPASLEEVISVPMDKQQTEEQSGEDESESFEITLSVGPATSPSTIDKGKDSTSLEEVISVPVDKQQTEGQSGEDESELFKETLRMGSEMESDDRRHLDVSPTLKAKLLELLESKKLPLEELAQALYIHDTSPYATVADLVNQYESRNQALTLEKWKFIFKKLHLSKELEDLLAVDQSVMMIGPTAVGEVNCSGSLPAEKSLQGTQPSQDLVEPRGVPLQDKPFLCVNDPSLKLPVVNPRAREGAIPKTKQPQPPPSTVKPDVGERMLIGAPGSQSDLNLPSIPGGDFGDKCPQSWSLHSPESIESAEWNAADCSILCDSSVQNEGQDTGFFSGEGNSCTQTTSSSSTALLYTPATGSEEYQDQNGASTVIPEPGKAKHGIQLLPSLSEDSQMQPGHSRTPAILTTPERAQSKHSPSTPDSSLTNIENDLRAREYQGAIPKRNWHQPSHSTVTHDVRQDSESNLNLPSIQAGDFTGNCPQSSSPPPELIEIAPRNSAGCEIFCDSLLRNENQDTESSSEEGNSLSQMTSLSTTRMDAPASGHEGIQHQNSASTTIPEGGKTKHQITKRQLDHCKITPARPNTPEGAQPGRNSLSLVTGRHNSRPNQTGEEDDRAVEHYDATENNGLLEETKQELESSQKSVLYLVKELREKESFCQTLRADLFQSRQTLEESRQQCANFRISRDNLQAENEELRRSLEEQQRLSNRILEENRRFRLLLARQAGGVAFEGSSVAVGEGNASDCSEVEPEADEQPGPFPYLQESDSEDSSDDEFFDALDH